jgi:putative Holliday junction resolvase
MSLRESRTAATGVIKSRRWQFFSGKTAVCYHAIHVAGFLELKSARHARRLLQTMRAMRILALDHGSKRIGVAVSDETKTIAQPLEYILAEPFADFLVRLKKILGEKEIDLILIGLPRNMDGSYGPAAQKVEAFVGVLKTAITVPIKMWDERLTSSQANKILIQGGVRRDKRKEKVDKMAAAILLQSYLDGM